MPARGGRQVAEVTLERRANVALITLTAPDRRNAFTAPMEVVGRFLALLELYRSRTVAFDQSEPLGVLQISWTGERPTSETLVEVRDES